MKASLTRKINLHKYGGNQYESADFFLEIEKEEIVKADIKRLEEDIEAWISNYIKHLPAQQTQLAKAIKEQSPF